VAVGLVAAWGAASVLGLPAPAQADSAPVYVASTEDPQIALADAWTTVGADATAPEFGEPDPGSVSWGQSLTDPGSDVAVPGGEPVVVKTATPTAVPTKKPTDVKQVLAIKTNVQQRWTYTCVAASVQTELGMALGSFNTSAAQQLAIYNWARAHLGFGLKDNQPGLDFIAWARALNYFSSGKVKYTATAVASGPEILGTMAKAMRTSGLPQGAAVRGGTHAWTIIGFYLSADPIKSRTFTVYGVYVAGPYQSWRDPPTGTYVKAANFLAYWEKYVDPYGDSPYNGKYLAVVGYRA
jgi:hypothetical protein